MKAIIKMIIYITNFYGKYISSFTDLQHKNDKGYFNDKLTLNHVERNHILAETTICDVKFKRKDLFSFTII